MPTWLAHISIDLGEPGPLGEHRIVVDFRDPTTGTERGYEGYRMAIDEALGAAVGWIAAQLVDQASAYSPLQGEAFDREPF